ncbi:protein kinase [Dactylosporangium sp. CA-092794]|uniref:protein kinase n=1 Tax=Dactylosporangium sp. CA-092794 TaxID=3239929 RepID=UPI003D89D36F
MELEGRYRLDRLIGAGATAEVWRGHDALLRRPVAIRLLRPGRPDRAERFLAAGRTAARLTHPGVAAVYDVGVTDLPGRGPTPFVVMELADGPTLAARLEAGPPLSRPEAARIAADIAAALAEAHGQRVAHGALNPIKVVLSEVGTKVFGFTGDLSADGPDRLPDRGDRSGGAARAGGGDRAGGAGRAADVGEGVVGDVRALGALLAACLGDDAGGGHAHGFGGRSFDALRAFAERCMAADPAVRPGSAEVAATLAGLADATHRLPAVRRLRSAAPRATRPAAAVFAGLVDATLRLPVVRRSHPSAPHAPAPRATPLPATVAWSPPVGSIPAPRAAAMPPDSPTVPVASGAFGGAVAWTLPAGASSATQPVVASPATPHVVAARRRAWDTDGRRSGRDVDGRRRVRWTVRAAIAGAGALALLLGGVALGQAGDGGRNWFEHPPEVAVVPPPDVVVAPPKATSCANAALDAKACPPAAASPTAHPAATTTTAPAPRRTTKPPRPSATRTTPAPHSSAPPQSPSASPSAPASPPPSASPSAPPTTEPPPPSPTETPPPTDEASAPLFAESV